MKKVSKLLFLLFFSLFGNCFSQSFEEKLLGKWKLTKDEGFEFFMNTPEAINSSKEEVETFVDWIEKVHDQTFMNFFSLDSMSSTIVDGKKIIQEKSLWNFRYADSVVTWQIRFHPKVLQVKVVKLTENELILVYLDADQKPVRFRNSYQKIKEDKEN
ncbi:hypothetical protein MMU07_04235 [Aquiflexum sp. LQ15W]|jgi:hypothetical protein|uniref:hypothetical protein n=1 Tax=Cognataquiflexum nitidum TaxID=2922272 RepID=UPI001F139E59|nr:hypothetical protein [Cognataquiflexum nitidum]MCH6198778.1 hypothetical protein [Cognataquiflexum nitidum]